MGSVTATATGLCQFIDASPSPFHAVDTVAQRLRQEGFTELFEARRWPGHSGDYFTVRSGSIVAWRGVDMADENASFRVIGAHTDSPNLRVKANADRVQAGWPMVALEPYGGSWVQTWLDRDLGLSGRVLVRDGDTVQSRLIRIQQPILRVPNLAIHMVSAEERKKWVIDPQWHVNSVWSGGKNFDEFIAEQLGVAPADVLGRDLMAHDLTAAALIGPDESLVSAPRLDNQASCYAGLEAFLAAESSSTLVLALFDHEEIGSVSGHGAHSDLLSTVLERIVLSSNGTREDFLRRAAASLMVSADMAHATHPNYPDRHEPGHQIAVNAGPVIKIHPNVRYATDGRGAAAFALACERAGVPFQRYEHRADMQCGSTIGPFAASHTGMLTVDVGAATLAMHSVRELMGARDVPMYSNALQAFLELPATS